jgi:prolyl oligopeptidase
MKIPSLIASAVLFLAAFARAGDAPPPAPIRPVTDDYHGTKIADPYRYMENLADPQVQAWIRAQGDYAQHVLRAIPGRDRLAERIAELDAGAPYRLSLVRRWPNGNLLYLKRLASENLDKLYLRDAKSGDERLLVDPGRFVEPGSKRHYSLSFCRPSPDGHYVAYGIAASGSEETTLHILDIAAGKDLPDTIDRMEFEYLGPCWLSDSSAFTYGRRRKLPADAPATEIYKQSKSFLHRPGADPNQDPSIFAMSLSPMVEMAAEDFPAVAVTLGSNYAIGQIKHGDDGRLTLYSAPVDQLARPGTPWKKICDIDDEVTSYAVHGDDIYLLTSSAAPRFRIMRISLAAPNFPTAPTVIPASTSVVQSLEAAHDALYVGLLDAGVERAVRVPYVAQPRIEHIPTPAGATSAWPAGAYSDVDGVYLHTSSWVRAGKTYIYNPADQSLTDAHLIPPGKFDDIPGYESHEVLVQSHDGVQVPLSILHKSGIPLDGSHATLVSGYGAYGFSTFVHFDPVRIAWLERGGVLAFAHVRGGGDLGRDWHLGGQKTNKPNTWKDFIGCCEYLVKSGYTSPPKLAGVGGSAGGILIGRAITERPDLFAAALIKVGCLDLLRSETTTNGVPNIPEFGTVTSLEGFQALYAMSAYHHVTDGVKYPAVLLSAGINDPRVEPWESAKMTARLQAATASGKPILFRVDYDAGHGIGSTKAQRHAELADQWSFLLWQMNDPEFTKHQ